MPHFAQQASGLRDSADTCHASVMPAQRRHATANDNHPADPLPLPVPAPTRDIEVAAQPAHAVSARDEAKRPVSSRKGWSLLVLGWMAVAVAALAISGGLASPSSAVLLVSAGLAFVATAMRAGSFWRTVTLVSSAITLGVAAFLAIALGPIAGHPVLIGLFGSLWLLLSGLAEAARSRMVGGLLVAVAGVSGAMALGTQAVALLPVLGAASFALLGVARAAVKAGLHTAEVHYLAAWGALTAIVAATPWTVTVLTGAETAVICGVLGLAGMAAWSLDGWRSVLTSVGLVIGATWAWSPDWVSASATQLGLDPAPLLQAVVAAAVISAGLALCARGLRRGETGTMLLGILATLGQIGVIVVLEPLQFEGLAVCLIMSTILSGWLLSARVG